MIKGRGLRFFLFLFLAVLVSVSATILWKYIGTDTNQIHWRLEEPVLYDDLMKERIKAAQAEDLYCVFWKKRKNVMVENPDFARRERVNAYGIAGNSAALFFHANPLEAGEEGHCLLSADIAHKLFGSTDVVGRTVHIEGRDYFISGVEYEIENLCVYQLSSEDRQKVVFAACRYADEKEKYMVKQKVIARILG